MPASACRCRIRARVTAYPNSDRFWVNIFAPNGDTFSTIEQARAAADEWIASHPQMTILDVDTSMSRP